jgi:hypothetical protein
MNTAKFCINFIFFPMLRTNILDASFIPSRKSIISSTYSNVFSSHTFLLPIKLYWNRSTTIACFNFRLDAWKKHSSQYVWRFSSNTRVGGWAWARGFHGVCAVIIMISRTYIHTHIHTPRPHPHPHAHTRSES